MNYELQPSCHKCGKVYPLDKIDEWKRWGFIMFTRNQEVWPYSPLKKEGKFYCENCYNEIVSHIKVDNT